MPETTKPIDDLREKNAAQLALTDYLLGHDDGSPAAFRTPIEEMMELLLGPIETNANGSFARLANGLQVCWASTVGDYGSGNAIWEYPQPFVETPFVVPVPRRSDTTTSVTVHILSTNYTPTQVTLVRSTSATLAAAAIGRWK